MPPLPPPSNTHVVVIFVITCVYGALSLSTTLMFLLYAWRDQRLSKRSMWLTCIGGLANTAASVNFLLAFTFLQSWPCYLNFIGSYLGFLLTMLAIVFRSIRLILISWHQESILRRRVGNVKGNTMWFVAPSQAAIERRLVAAFGVLILIDIAYVLITLLTDEYHGTPGVQSVAWRPYVSYECTVTIEFYPFYILLAFILVVLFPLSLYFLYKIQDGYGIKTSLTYTMTIGIVCYILYFLWIPFNLAQFHEYWSAALFPLIGCLVIHITSVVIPLSQLRSDYISKATLPDMEEFDRMLNNPVMFAKFCQHCVKDFSAENTRFVEDYQLLKFMTMESFKNISEEHEMSEIEKGYDYSDNSSDSIAIPTALTIYNIPPPSVSISRSIIDFLPEIFREIKDESEAKSIEVPERLRPAYFGFYSTFIKTESILEANLSACVTSPVRKQIEAGQYTLDMFELAKKEILELLWFNAYPKFLKQTEKQNMPWLRERKH